MKIKLLSALIATAFAGVAPTASAGIIQASFKNFAAEVFGSDAVTLTAPTVNYALQRPLSGTLTNPNSFTISWTLESGEWATTPLLAAVELVTPANTDQLNPTAMALSNGNKTLTATFSVNNGINYTVGSQIVLGTTGAANIAQITKLAKLGQPAIDTDGCTDSLADIKVSVRMTNAAGVDFDSSEPNAQNTTPIAQSKVALSVTATDSATFVTPELSKVDVLIGSLGKFFTDPADVTSPSTARINIGSVNVKDKAQLFDWGGQFFYSTRTAAFATNPTTGAGIVEANGLKVDVSGNFLTGAQGGSFFVSALDNCSASVQTGTIAADGKSATVTLTAAQLAGLQTVPANGVNPAYLCYATTNANVIPTSQFRVTAGSLTKFQTAGTNEIANKACPAPIYNLVSNGVKVDVRNYIPKVATDASGWFSVVRVINTDEVQTVSPVIQALLASGVLGASSSLDGVVSTNNKSGPFAPREVRYYINSALDAVLSAATNGPSYGAADVGGNARLRITAPSSSIRVQNYLYNPATGNFIEGSAAQSDEGPEADQKNTQNNR